MKLGFTGTSRGMTNKQKASLKNLLRALLPSEFHHGDCVGADDEADDMISVHTECHIHPCNLDHMRAFNESPHIHEAYPPLVRNHHIVDATDALIATPGERNEVLRSGTWATIRYARKKHKRIYMIYPDGEIVLEGDIPEPDPFDEFLD